jgi:hypothetical protein
MVCTSARYVRFQRSDISEVTMTMATKMLIKYSEFVIAVLFVNGGTFLQEVITITFNCDIKKRKMFRKSDRM